ncbi:MAG: sugar phosphate isomerase/epimerase family protein, partial [Planctomycetota bacterium]
IDDSGLERCRSLLQRHKMRATSLSWAGGFTGSDGRGFDDAVGDAMNAIAEAAELRVDTLIVLAGGRNNHIRKHARRTLCEALSRIAIVAEEFGVKFALEPIHPGCGQEWSFVNDLESTMDVIEQVNNPQLGIVLDTYHVGMDDDVLSLLPRIAKQLQLLQLGDGRHSPMGEMNRCLLGHGSVPNHAIVSALSEHGYDGPIEAEVIGEDVETLCYEEVLDHTVSYLTAIDPGVPSGGGVTN